MENDADELVLCARYGEEEELKALLESHGQNEAFVNHQNEWGQSALQCAAANGHAGIVKMLLEAGADPNRQNKEGNTPLHWAALMGQADCLRLMLETGKADVNARNLQGRTALDEAHDKGHSKAFDLLVEKQALPGQKAIEEAEKLNEMPEEEAEEALAAADGVAEQ